MAQNIGQDRTHSRPQSRARNQAQNRPQSRIQNKPKNAAMSRRERNIRQRARLRRRKRKLLAGFILTGIIIVLGITNLILYKAVSRYPKDTICKNVYVGNVDVSGMKAKEAKAAVEKQLEKDKTRTVSVKVGKESAEGTLEELGLKYKSVKAAVGEAMEYGKKGSLLNRYLKLRRASKQRIVIEEKLALDKETGETVLEERLSPLTEHAKNATIKKKGSGFKIGKEKDGETVSIPDSFAKIEGYLNDNWNHKDFSVTADIEKEKPSVTAEDLKDITDELGSFSTDAGSGERIQNLKTGVKKLSDIVLMPNEVLSVEELTKPYTEENGYVMGGSYEGGRVVESYGGGLCQVSTTLYNAVIYAELEVVERYPHSMLVDYVKPSRDAAVAEGYLDFKFKNNYDTPIYIAGGIDDSNQLYFEIYGKDTREKGRKVEFESEVLSTEDAGVTYEENSEAPIGSVQAVSGAHAGMEAMLWKIVYQDGEEVSREAFNNSSYKKADTIYEVGTMSDNPDATALVQNAIATQDEEQIYAAIGAVQ